MLLLLSMRHTTSSVTIDSGLRLMGTQAHAACCSLTSRKVFMMGCHFRTTCRTFTWKKWSAAAGALSVRRAGFSPQAGWHGPVPEDSQLDDQGPKLEAEGPVIGTGPSRTEAECVGASQGRIEGVTQDCVTPPGTSQSIIDFPQHSRSPFDPQYAAAMISSSKDSACPTTGI